MGVSALAAPQPSLALEFCRLPLWTPWPDPPLPPPFPSPAGPLLVIPDPGRLSFTLIPPL